jgi:hypothetical protein
MGNSPDESAPAADTPPPASEEPPNLTTETYLQSSEPSELRAIGVPAFDSKEKVEKHTKKIGEELKAADKKI